jgi:hypothetical protein
MGGVNAGPICSMEGFSRREALGSIAGIMIGFGIIPSEAKAQYIMSGKEKAGSKKGPRCEKFRP